MKKMVLSIENLFSKFLIDFFCLLITDWRLKNLLEKCEMIEPKDQIFDEETVHAFYFLKVFEVRADHLLRESKMGHGLTPTLTSSFAHSADLIMIY